MEDTTIPTPKKVNNGSLTDEEIKEALFKNAGHQGKAAASLKYSRNYICERINESEYLKRAYDDIREYAIDDAESSLRDLILAKEFNAVCFFLKTIGKNRGYTENKVDSAISPEMLAHLGDFMSKIYVKPNDETPIRTEAD